MRNSSMTNQIQAGIYTNSGGSTPIIINPTPPSIPVGPYPYIENPKGGNINGSDNDDTLYGSVGNDTIDGGLGNNLIIAGPGNDTVYADLRFYQGDINRKDGSN